MKTSVGRTDGGWGGGGGTLFSVILERKGREVGDTPVVLYIAIQLSLLKRETIFPEGREGAIVNQTNIGTCFKGDAGETSSAERLGGAHNYGLF